MLIILPVHVKISGISSVSYFKFGIIVSLLAFISGYDPSHLHTFLLKVPFLGGDTRKEKGTPDKKDESV